MSPKVVFSLMSMLTFFASKRKIIVQNNCFSTEKDYRTDYLSGFYLFYNFKNCFHFIRSLVLRFYTILCRTCNISILEVYLEHLTHPYLKGYVVGFCSVCRLLDSK